MRRKPKTTSRPPSQTRRSGTRGPWISRTARQNTRMLSTVVMMMTTMTAVAAAAATKMGATGMPTWKARMLTRRRPMVHLPVHLDPHLKALDRQHRRDDQGERLETTSGLDKAAAAKTARDPLLGGPPGEPTQADRTRMLMAPMAAPTWLRTHHPRALTTHREEHAIIVGRARISVTRATGTTADVQTAVRRGAMGATGTRLSGTTWLSSAPTRAINGYLLETRPRSRTCSGPSGETGPQILARWRRHVQCASAANSAAIASSHARSAARGSHRQKMIST